MSAINYPSYNGAPSFYKDNRGKSNLINHPVLAIVKDNIDPTHSGRIRVYIANYGGIDPNNDKDWITVNYMSPWFGSVIPKKDTKNPENAKYGAYVGNPISYGMWASAPDIGSTVICIFINGRPDQGYYIGGTPVPGLHQMVPAMGSTTGFVPNSVEATTYADAKKLPVSEVNISSTGIKNSTSIYTEPKPVHSYQAAILSKQGLIRDEIRGTISSSSQRETPSRVFGISTPGGTIYQGGYTNANVGEAAKTADQSKVQVAGRTGGHSIVMDDGTIDGKDQLMRFRTSGGHMIMMSDSGQSIFIIHSNGQSWVELGKEGTVDIWSSNSFNVRSMGDINLHADRDVNIHAGRNLNMFGTAVKTEADTNMTVRSGLNFSAQHGGNYSMKAAGTMSLQSMGTASFMSIAGQNYINGLRVNLNNGIGPQPANVSDIPKIKHEDTIYTQEVGWMSPGLNPLVSIASRVTAHQPWAGANKGVDVTVNQVAPAPATNTDPTLSAINSSVPSVPSVPISMSEVATVPGTKAVTNQDNTVLKPTEVNALISAQAAAASNLSSTEAAARGIIPGAATAMTLIQAESGGAMKPGTASFVEELMNKGASFQQAAQQAVTGAFGISSPQALLGDVKAQVNIIGSSIQQSATDLVNKGFSFFASDNSKQTAGPLLAASNFGTDSITGFLSNTKVSLTENFSKISDGLTSSVSNISSITNSVTNVGESIKGVTNMISSGQFATNLADKAIGQATDLASGFATNLIGQGISKILGPLGGKINTLGSILAGLQQTAKQNFLTAEASFKPLVANKPNYPDGEGNQNQESESVKLLSSIQGIEDNLIQLELDLLTAKKQFRDNQSIENANKIAQLETTIGKTKQQLATLNNKILSVNTNQSPDQIIAKISQTGSLPGFTTPNIVKDGLNAINGLKNLSLESALKNIPPTAKKIIGSITGGSSGVKQAVLAENTSASTTKAENAKAGQLLDNPIIPPPVFETTTSSIDPNIYLRQQTAVLNTIADLRAQQEILAAQLAQVDESILINSGDSEAYRRMTAIKEKLTKVELALNVAQSEYDRLITG